MKRSVLIYVAAIVALNALATIAVAFIAPLPRSADWTASVFFALMGVVALLLSYQRSGATAAGSVSFLPFLSGVLVAPTVAAPITVSIASLLAHFALRRPTPKVIFNSSQYGVATAAAVAVLSQVGALTREGLDATHIALFTVAALVFLAANSLLVVGAISLAERRVFWITWKKTVSTTLLYDVLGLPLIAVLAVSYVNVGLGTLFVIMLPLFGLRQFYKQNAELEKTAREFLELMVAVVEARDPYTSGHSRRVSAYSRIIAKSAKFPARSVDRVAIAALLHDVGKIDQIYTPILSNPGRLTAEEYQVIQTHPAKSAALVAKVSSLRDVVASVRAHHERWDGFGYPDRLAGEAIPVGARVVALADTIDAMRTNRPYRPALDTAQVRSEIERGRGSQFDPVLVDALLQDEAWTRLLQAIRRFERFGPDDALLEHEIDRIDDPSFGTAKAPQHS